MKPLDRTDCAILARLQQDVRLSNKELAAAVGLAPSSCLARVRRLEETGVLRGAHADVEPHAAGIGVQALVSVQLTRHSRELVDAFQAHAVALPEVVQLFHVTGRSDFLIHVAVRNADHLRDLTLTAFTRWPEVARIETSLVYAYHRSPTLPLYEPE
jgi:DNA-binding Lrp family transcriptional regulator